MTHSISPRYFIHEGKVTLSFTTFIGEADEDRFISNSIQVVLSTEEILRTIEELEASLRESVLGQKHDFIEINDKVRTRLEAIKSL